ncbi:hypothetical protein GZ77_18070 [Endozoicomonas montiporae]|uniref:Cytochrome P450 n=2 Tax=Endozoicomonas montiporae TaxID=1027273 RepID=A0A081N1W4_9GAMM|nr:cytochrome P450 [Endozoicomonas montiporae]AMO58617.1 biotin biosynthesis cytochrome P450 [Endozoicomonas montiporae CL-33]KEQ12437.1 hypothetical protein GZ77_18070 [Endozoicomonas montiporae]
MTTNKYHIAAPEHLDHPYPVYKALREQQPVFYDESLGFHVVTGYKNVKTLLAHPQISSCRQRFMEEIAAQLPPGTLSDYIENSQYSMIQLDPPEHTRLRKVANTFFHKPTVQGWVPVMEQQFHSLLSSEMADGHIDVCRVARTYPSEVICDLFGMPEEYREQFITNTIRLGRIFGSPPRDQLEHFAREANQASVENMQLIADLLKERMDHPSDDLLGSMAKACAEDLISINEAASLSGLLMAAGHLTTTEMICNGVYQLLSHPDQWQWLKENPDAIEQAIEEIIRFDSSVPFIFKSAKGDIQLEGGQLASGDIVAIGLLAANHDPVLCDRPDEFDITREPSRHLSFSTGPHVCPGALMAKAELKVAFVQLIQACSDLCFDPANLPVRRCNTVMFRGFESLKLLY